MKRRLKRSEKRSVCGVGRRRVQLDSASKNNTPELDDEVKEILENTWKGGRIVEEQTLDRMEKPGQALN